jgi:hypothetical protein
MRCFPKEVPDDRSRLKAGDIGKKPCAGKDKAGKSRF